MAGRIRPKPAAGGASPPSPGAAPSAPGGVTAVAVGVFLIYRSLLCRVPLCSTRQSPVLLLLLCRELFGTRQRFCWVPEKRHSAKPSLPSLLSSCGVECRTRQSFCRVQYGLCRVFPTLGKEDESDSVDNSSIQ